MKKSDVRRFGWWAPLGLLLACNSSNAGATGGASGIGGAGGGGAANAESGGTSAGGEGAAGGNTAAAGFSASSGGSITGGGTAAALTATGGLAELGTGGNSGMNSGGNSSASDAGSDASANIPPVPDLWYEIELNVWVKVKPGDTVIRPVDKDINWGACNSSDPDGHVVEIWLFDGALSQLMGPGLECIQEYTEQTRTPVNTAAYLQVIDDKGAQSELTFYYQTQ